MMNNNILQAIAADAGGEVFCPLKQGAVLFYRQHGYHPFLKTFAVPKFNLETGGITAFTFPISHPAVLGEGGRPMRGNAFMDLSSAQATLYHGTAKQQMGTKAPNLSPLDYCVGVESVNFTANKVLMAIIDNQFSNVQFKPNWKIDWAKPINDIVIGGKVVAGLNNGRTFRIFTGNCPNPAFMGSVDKDGVVNTTVNGTQIEASMAEIVDRIGADPRIMRFYRNIPEEIIVKRLNTLWDFFREENPDYFGDEALRNTFLEESISTLLRGESIAAPPVTMMPTAPKI